MSNLVLPGDFFQKPPPILIKLQALERLVAKYESLLESQVKVLACLALNSEELRKSKKIKQVQDGFAIPYNWQEDLPMTVDLNIVEDHKAGQIVVRLLKPAPRNQTVDNTGWTIPDEQKVMEDDTLGS